jgi:hypothetical protein
MKKIVSDLIKAVTGPAEIVFQVKDGETIRIVDGNGKEVKPRQHDIIINLDKQDLNV